MKAISADSHVVEGPGVFEGLAERFGDEAPRVVHKDGRGDFIVVPSWKSQTVNVAYMALAATRLDAEGGVNRRKGHKPDAGTLEAPEVQAYVNGGYAAMRPGLTDGSQRGADQDIDGLTAEFLYPGYFRMFAFRNVDLLVALQKNYNDWLHDHCAASGGRLYGIAALPVQDPNAAVAEIDRILKMGYRAAIIPSNAPEGRRYCDPEYDPLWARAEEAGLPLSMHVGCYSHVPAWVREASRGDGIFTYSGTASFIQETLIELMCRGVCERFPRLQFVVAEFNAGWIAHWLERVDQGWQREFGTNPSGPAYRRVDEIWKRQFYATIEDDQPALRTRDLIGEDRLMWGADYPHTDSTWPCSAEVLDEMFDGYPETTRRSITVDNVKRLYKL